MHIPDGFLSPPVWAALDLASIPAIGILARRAGREIEESRIPLLGVMGAFVFAAQMINFPVGLGTSGHLVGGALLAMTLGPGSAVMVMTAILAIQAFVFQDGGVVVLGANLMNMAVAGVLAGYLPYRLLHGTRYRRLGVFAGAALSVMVSALLALVELLLSGVRMPGAILGVSLALFLVSAVLEGLITVAVLQAIERIHPGWVQEPAPSRSAAFAFVALASVLLAGAGVLFASQSPDGIEKLSQQIGLAQKAQTVIATPLADYEVPGLDSPWLRKAAAGLAGVIGVYAACLAVGKLAARRRSAKAGSA